MSAPVVPRTVADLDVSQDVLESLLQAGRLAEQRHQVLDLDADSVWPVPSDFARSVADGFVSLPDWGDAVSARPVADVQTGGLL